MNYQQTLLLPFLSLLFISCGDSTSSAPIIDIASIEIADKNISILSTDLEKELSATILYTDGSTASSTTSIGWSSSDTSIIYTYGASIVATKNSGDANISAAYGGVFKDSTSVHVKELLSINYSDINVSDIGTVQTLYVSGNFENNETNMTMYNNISWSVDSNATIIDINATQMTLTVDYNTSSILLEAVLFTGTDNQVDFNKTFY